MWPPNDTPENTILRFIAAYERKDTTVFSQLFTGDYQYKFSETADPDLAREYASGWFKADEHVSARNLFHGRIHDNEWYQPGAQTIELEMEDTAPLGDELGGRDPVVYKVLETPIRLTIQLPPDENDPEGTTFSIGGTDRSVQRFSLVRGDATDSLGAGQPADDGHWYIWLWEDLAIYECGRVAAGAANTEKGRPGNVCGSTWGGVKDLYR
jgi:hypothetical protein